MRARAPLMIEHRLIERMISHIKDALVQIESTHKEDQAMLAEFWEFDRKMIHEKHESVVEKLEKRQ